MLLISIMRREQIARFLRLSAASVEYCWISLFRPRWLDRWSDCVGQGRIIWISIGPGISELSERRKGVRLRWHGFEKHLGGGLTV